MGGNGIEHEPSEDDRSPERPAPGGDVRSTMSGSADNVVQARDVYGGIHVTYRGPRPAVRRRSADRDSEDQLLSRYLAYVEQTYQSAKLSALPSLGDRPRRDIKDLFVEPRLRRADALNTGVVQANSLTGRRQMSVVLGEPGSGKSYLLQYFAWRNASEALAGNRSARIPFHIPLGHQELAEWSWTDDDALFPFGFLRHLVSTAGVRLTESLITRVVKTGRALFLFDGLDEIAGAGVKSIVVERLANTRFGLHALNDRNRMILTARPSEADVLEGLEAEQFVLGGFDAHEIKRFAQNWYGSADGDRESRRFLTMISHPRLRRLTSSPLYLTIMALLDPGSLDPAVGGRSDLFEQLTRHMLYRDKSRFIAEPEVPEKIKRLRVEELAMLLQDTHDNCADGRPSASVTAAVDLLTAHIVDYHGLDRGQAESEAERFLKWCADRAGLIEFRGEAYSFRHETLQHYFVATALDTRASDGRSGSTGRAPDRRDALISRFGQVHQPCWTEPLLFLAGRLTREEATDVVEAVLDQKVGYEHFHHKNLIMAIRVLGECQIVRAATRDKVLKEMLGRLGLTSNVRRRSAVGRRAHREAALVLAALRGTLIEDDVIGALNRVLDSSRSNWARARACELLGALASARPAAVDHLVTALEDGDPTVQDNARRALVIISRFDENVAGRLRDLLGAGEVTEQVRIHACRALMHLHQRHADTLRAAFFAEGASGKLRREWARATVEGWADPDGTWEADRHGVVACLLDAFAAPAADSKLGAAWIAGRLRLKDPDIHAALNDLLGYSGEKSDNVRSAAVTALERIAGVRNGDQATPVPSSEPATHRLVRVPEGYHYLGEVLHYWPQARAALVDLARPFGVGEELVVLSPQAREGKPMERFRQVLDSMQVEGMPLNEADSGMSVALALKEPVRAGERLYTDRVATRP